MMPASASSHRSPRARSPLTARLGWLLFASLLLGAPLLLGGAPAWAPGLIAGWAAVALLLSPRIPESQPLTRGEAGAALAAVVAAVWTGLQAVPFSALPVRDAALEAWRLLGEPPPPGTLSLDPAATAEHLVVALAAAATMLAALAWIRAGQRGALVRVLAASGALVAAVGLGHLAAGAERLYGLHAPRFARPTLLTPLLNPNHMAGFLAAGATLSAGLALGSRRRSERFAWAVVVVLQAGVALAGLSRAGTAALLAGALLSGLWVRPRVARRLRKHPWLAWGGAAAVAVVGWASLAPLFDRLSPEDLGSEGKLRVWESAVAVLLGHPVAGVGRGAFGAASAALHEGAFAIRSPESLPLQWASEWGVPIALLLAVLFGRPLLRVAREARSAEGRAAVAGVAVLLLHSLADFVLELPAVAVWGVAAYAAAIGGRREGEQGGGRHGPGLRFRRAWSRLLTFRLVAAATLVAAVGLGPRLPSWRLQGTVDRLGEALARGDGEAFESVLREGLRLHPVEPALLVLGAEYAVVTASPQAESWVRLALRRAGGWAQAWLLEARVAWRQGKTSRTVEAVAEAARRDPRAAARFLARLASDPRWPDAALAPLLQRLGEGAHPFLVHLATALHGRPTLAAAVDARLLELEPDRPDALLRTARRWLAAGAPGEAVELLRGPAGSPGAPVGLLLAYAEALRGTGKEREALEVLREATRRHPQRREAWKALAEAAARQGLREEMLEALAAYRGLAGGSPERLAATYRLQAELERLLDRPAAAARALLEADRIQPDDRNLEVALELARSAGQGQLAGGIRRRLCARSPRACSGR